MAKRTSRSQDTTPEQTSVQSAPTSRAHVAQPRTASQASDTGAVGQASPSSDVAQPVDRGSRAGGAASFQPAPTPSSHGGSGEQFEDRSEQANRSESMGSEPSDEDIRLRAYQRYLERGGTHGAHDADWFAAEQELKGSKRQS